jgi:hypothetical protein
VTGRIMPLIVSRRHFGEMISRHSENQNWTPGVKAALQHHSPHNGIGDHIWRK